MLTDTLMDAALSLTLCELWTCVCSLSLISEREQEEPPRSTSSISVICSCFLLIYCQMVYYRLKISDLRYFISSFAVLVSALTLL